MDAKKYNARTRTPSNPRLEMKLRNGAVRIAKGPNEPQHHGSVHGMRKPHAQRTRASVTLDAISSATIASITATAITTRTWHARRNRDHDLGPDPSCRNFDRVPTARTTTSIECGAIDDTTKRLRHTQLLTARSAVGKCNEPVELGRLLAQHGDAEYARRDAETYLAVIHWGSHHFLRLRTWLRRKSRRRFGQRRLRWRGPRWQQFVHVELERIVDIELE
jgi:hypothetical protein